MSIRLGIFGRLLRICLCCRYSLSLDKAVEDMLCEMKTEGEREALHDILRVTTSAVKYQMVTDDSTTLYLGLHHTRSALRTLAVEQLANNLSRNLVSCIAQFSRDRNISCWHKLEI